jgi:glycerol-3-phosphate dehydrogenase
VANYARVDRLEVADGRVRGATVSDLLGGGTCVLRAHVVVNATGPWADQVAALAGERAELRLTKGVHLAVPRARLGHTEAITVLSPIDERVMFVIPWGDLSYVGTTDTDFMGDPDDVRPDADDVLYLLRSANALFPHARLQPGDVVSAWAGLRPLLRPADAKAPSAVSREHRVLRGRSGLISVIGGKLTTYRSMAEEAVDQVAGMLEALDGRRRIPPARTDREPLPGGQVRDTALLVADLVREGVDPRVAARIVRRYGTEAAGVVRLWREDPALAAPIAPDHPATRAEVVHAVRREMAVTLSDVLVRRVQIFHELRGQAVPEAPDVASLVARELGWDAPREARELASYLEAAAGMMAFRATIQRRFSDVGAR